MNCVEALGSLFYIIHMRTFRESTQIFCSSLNGAQLALLHAACAAVSGLLLPPACRSVAPREPLASVAGLPAACWALA